jgi:acyl carrier protein
MDRTQALEVVKQAVVEVLAVEASAIGEQTNFKDDLEADSLDLVELVMALEERFDITVPEEDLEGVTTVGAALDLVLARMAVAS